jgi:WD40 repeat protein
MTHAIVYLSPSEKFPAQDLLEEDRLIMEAMRSKVCKTYEHCCASQDGKSFFTIDSHEIFHWYERNSSGGFLEIQTFNPKEGMTYHASLRCMKLSQDERTLYLGFGDKTIQIWKKNRGGFQKFQIFYAQLPNTQ